MPKQPSDEEALARLGQRADALQARTARKQSRTSYEASGAGYKLVAELVSGVLGGLGLGWLVDRFAHTSPFGLIVGVLGGAIASVVLVVISASRMGDQARKGAPADSVPVDDEDDV